MSWNGYYVQCNKQHLMSFDNLNVVMQAGGSIQGNGVDTVGRFTVTGAFAHDRPVGRFVKQYEGMHAVYYEGTLNA